MLSRTITLRPGESFVTADGVKVEARIEEQERREQASLDAIPQAHAAALQAFDNVKEQIRAQQALVSAQQSMTGLSLAGPSAPRAISITDLDDRIVITVGAAELRLTHEEATRLFAIGRGANDKPQQKGGA
ncbi:hypothetical protein LGR64_12375 [Delftia sp. Lp-1]|uniref:hypothetical protein n=1 Tax=Delftia sp. Lp-1 TaxID=682863 RepID=UPI001E2CB314|nr:hypothetical protein [Delftia sp. Lp-1]MCB4787076.1 hypothetical protein [Delftia sp. Lp-1]